MYYLERNQLLIAEAQDKLIPKRGQNVGSSTSRMSFVPIGCYYSDICGENIFLGVKAFKSAKNTLELGPKYFHDRVIEELATIAFIAEYLPKLRKALPQVYGLLKNPEDEPIGLFMEDFSQGGKFGVYTMSSAPPEIITLFGKDVLEEDQICNMGFGVNRTFRYCDFFPLFVVSERNAALAKLPINQIIRDLSSYTLRLKSAL